MRRKCELLELLTSSVFYNAMIHSHSSSPVGPNRQPRQRWAHLNIPEFIIFQRSFNSSLLSWMYFQPTLSSLFIYFYANISAMEMVPCLPTLFCSVLFSTNSDSDTRRWYTGPGRYNEFQLHFLILRKRIYYTFWSNYYSCLGVLIEDSIQILDWLNRFLRTHLTPRTSKTALINSQTWIQENE